MEEKQDHSDTPVKEEFQCKIDGCKQSFTTELHCNVHTKKHDLSLNLEMPLKGPGVIFADQTPTPTRLIGKCEEVGLFEDLQKVNPFDETFRRAVESGASSGSSLSGEQTPLATPHTTISLSCRAADGETLHTPHIFPSGVDRSSLDPVGSENVAAKQRQKIKASGTSLRTKQQQLEHAVTVNKSSKKTPTKRKTPSVVDILPKPSVQHISHASESIPVIIIPSGPSDTKLPAEGNVHVKEKLKEHLAKVRETSQGPKESTSAKKRVKHEEGKAEAPIKPAKPVDLIKPTDEKVDLKHERWKEAAKRYRLRVKKSQDQQLQRNRLLEEENIRLRTQLAEMQYAHRNCNVTRSNGSLKVALVQGTLQSTANASVAQQDASAALLNTIEQQQQQPAPLSVPQQRLITSHIIDSNTFNRMPIIILMGSTAAQPAAPAVVSGVSDSGSGALQDGTG
ncbi:cyclic AMP-dependent transcription factor ATF-7 [Anopheles marshallii]|uniref:cyclic AMP-dependent transcription factor ATF-7 n=1 Tax=Anopheles marshallii TaxID=1521116 RepID=UPI00237B6CF3|nr:cyclic AMP-dependent transcription factor ATF-7 [Anopheles marshallii]